MLEGIEDLKRGNGRARPCAVTQWLDTLDAETRAQAEEVLADKEYKAPRVQELFNRNRAQINRAQTITRHRNGICCQDVA